MTAPDLEEKTQLTMTILDAGLRGDGEAYDAAFSRIAEDGWRGMYGACCALANAMHIACPVPGEGDFIGLQAIDLRTGRTVSIDRSGMDPDLIAAMRIIIAIGNNDYAAAGDVFYAAVGAGHGNDTVAWVAALVIARLLRHPKYRKVYGDGPR